MERSYRPLLPMLFALAFEAHALSLFILPVEYRGKAAAAEAFTFILSDAFVRSQRFTVPERERIKAYIAEQGVSLKSRQAGQICGTVFGVDYLINAEMRSFKAGERAFDKRSTCQVSAEIAVRVVEASSGRTVHQGTKRLERTLDGDCPVLRPEDIAFLKSPAGTVLTDCIDEAIADAIAALQYPPLDGRIIKIERGTAYCSLGERHSIVVGQRFDIVSIRDETPFALPDGQTNVKHILITNLIPGELSWQLVGKARIIEVHRDFSIMELLSFPAVIPPLATLRIREESMSKH
ncbi:MAG: hypothetical protein AABZ39_19325 [Spirochaetota bacterium]